MVAIVIIQKDIFFSIGRTLLYHAFALSEHQPSESTFTVYRPCVSFFFFNFFLNRVILVISVVLSETTITISDSTGEPVSIEVEIMRVVSLSTTEISEITQLNVRSSRYEYLKCPHIKN